MGLVGLFAYLYRERRAQGVKLEAHAPTLERDLLFFLAFFAPRRPLAWGPPAPVRIAVGIVFLLAYPLYVRRTLRPAATVQEEETLEPLVFERRPERPRDPRLGALRGAAPGRPRGDGRRRPPLRRGAARHRRQPRRRALVLALILAPLATELPEKVNSFFWVREGKDALALGNITGAMVFQSTIPIGIGLIFTDWELSSNAVALDRPRPRGRPPRLREPPPPRPLQATGGARLVRALRGLHHHRRPRCLSLSKQWCCRNDRDLLSA